MAQILHQSPFSPDLLKHNEAQLDFILEMYATDHPKEMTFVRPGKVGPAEMPRVAKRWADVLRGKALAEFMAKRMPSEAVLKVLRARSQAGAVRPVVRRKAPDANDQH